MSRNARPRAIYGQKFEEDDDEKEFVSKKPTPIQDQIATDERGKRRFHGAFTGGFSAGYWNTVGSKQGWVPQEFSSSRDNRGDRVEQRAEDFMDAEDLGEFGIGNRAIKRTAAFGETAAAAPRRMAWERDAASADVSTIAEMLEDVVRPVSDSIGVRMLRAMGWREGRGVGLVSVKQKAKQRGGETAFDREQRQRLAPSHEFANEDVLVKQLTPLNGVHGLGYAGLRHTSVLDETFGQSALALKSSKTGKGIRGQAFGVGAFEDDDDSVYTSYDLSQFDFSLDVSGRAASEQQQQQRVVDATFVLQPNKLNARKFYAPPRLPSNFRGDHKPIPMDTRRLPTMMLDDVRQMSALQRAKFLGENRASVMELVSSKDRKRLERRSRWDIRADEADASESRHQGGEIDEERDRRERNRVEYPDEPLKQARFKQFVLYTRRGLAYPQPTDVSIWEWESEKKEFETRLTAEERAMLPEVRSRAKPLAKTSIAAPIHEILASKFVKEASGELSVGRKDEDKLAAVKMGMFGDRTRQSFQWYPDPLLVKRFNVPNPYPGAEMVGVPHLQKTTIRKEMTAADLGLPSVGLPNTANELQMREKARQEKLSEQQQRAKEDENLIKNEVEVEDDDDQRKIDENETDDESDEEKLKEEAEKAPKSFFDYVFGGGGASSSSSSDSDETDSEDERRRNERKANELHKRKMEIEKKIEMEKSSSATTTRMADVVEIADEPDVEIIEHRQTNSDDLNRTYGPEVPKELSASQGLTAFSVLKYLQDDLKKRREHKKKKKKNKKKEEKRKKEEKKHKKSKKSKKEKKAKKRHSSSSSSDSSDWEEASRK
ncbi:unnamed protein product [Caenorhabditis bovis]|uniref:G-patch domain-containing protein n=1 Tax=Caenorhabditis bovis TaxID=2654633 RepID=A0A8S1EV05_9PELO|nr:unnamed protein product [Caenorhabditis bovis]